MHDLLEVADQRQQLLQDLGFLAFTLPQMDILMPTKKPRGEELTREQHVGNQALHCRRLRIEHVNRSVKRCRIVKDRLRLWKEGIRAVVMDICGALHNVRVRLTPCQPMVESGSTQLQRAWHDGNRLGKCPQSCKNNRLPVS